MPLSSTTVIMNKQDDPPQLWSGLCMPLSLYFYIIFNLQSHEPKPPSLLTCQISTSIPLLVFYNHSRSLTVLWNKFSGRKKSSPLRILSHDFCRRRQRWCRAADATFFLSSGELRMRSNGAFFLLLRRVLKPLRVPAAAHREDGAVHAQPLPFLSSLLKIQRLRALRPPRRFII